MNMNMNDRFLTISCVWKICLNQSMQKNWISILKIYLNQNSFVFTQYSVRSSISATRHLQIIQKVTWISCLPADATIKYDILYLVESLNF